MASEPTYDPVDPAVSPHFPLFSASASRPPTSIPSHSDPPRPPSHADPHAFSESDALLDGHTPARKPFYRPRPLWLVPFAIVASVVRGMTLAPRVQVYTQLSCNAVYGHDGYNHTTTQDGALSHFPTPHLPSLEVHNHNPHLTPDGTVFVTFDDGSTDGDEPDPRRPPSERCLKDPAVQSQAARLQTIMTTTMGLLSALTTGWWGTYGEAHGRTRVLAFATFGLFMTDLVFILVSTPHSIFAAHGHKLLVISPIIEGLCGGWATLQATTSAYISDCTSDGSRAHIFSRFTGVFFLGLAIGPIIGAFLIRHPFIPIFSPAIGVHNGAPTVTSVFYVAATASFINLMLVIFLFPESLHKKRAKAAASVIVVPTAASLSNTQDRPSALMRLLLPLALFLPKRAYRPDGSKHTDWRMTLLAVVLFGHLLTGGLFQIKYLYAEHVYGWGAEQLSYYISFMGLARTWHLLLILPFIIATFKPRQPAPPTNTAANKPNVAALVKEMHFDMSLIRGSLLIDLFSHSLVAFSPWDYGPFSGQMLFVGATSLNAFGAGLVPAVNSLALCIMQSRGESDSGKVFGAFSTLQATGQMIIAPVLFGVIYSRTVASFPKAIFAVAGCMVFASLVVVLLLRPDAMLRPPRKAQRLGPGGAEAQAEAAAAAPRGRSRKSKDIRQPSLVGEMYYPFGPGSGQRSYGATSTSGEDVGEGSSSGF